MMRAPWRIFWLFVLGVHVVAALGWWWLAPGGFAVSHPRFWSNRVAPGIVLAAVATAVWAARRDRIDVFGASLATFPTAWAAGAASLRLEFPITFERLFLAPLFGSVLMALAGVLAFRGRASASGRLIGLVVVPAALFGGLTPMAFRPPGPDTRPLEGPTPGPIVGTAVVEGGIATGVFVHVGDGSASIKARPLTLSIQPMLRFLDHAPDGAPTVLVPRRVREVPDLRLVAAAPISGGLDLRYRADHDAAVRVEAGGDGLIRLDASAFLPAPIWSHLNSYSDIDVSGHHRLALAFSPCPGERIEVRAMDYPIGRPLRFAFLDAGGRFRVVEAASGEKGPFRELAAGPLARGEPLAITLYDGDEAAARITLEDWSAQLGTQLSPTAGWGAPVNAIEFSLAGDEPTSTASIYLTLAATSVGRGWDCVGHRAGRYRNRMRVEILGARS